MTLINIYNIKKNLISQDVLNVCLLEIHGMCKEDRLCMGRLMCCQRLGPSCSQSSHICKGVEGVGYVVIATYENSF